MSDNSERRSGRSPIRLTVVAHCIRRAVGGCGCFLEAE